jgi:long-chain acyl-CoA synthetase
MGMTYDEAVAAVTGPGQMLEMAPVEVDGITYRGFANAPASLRDLLSLARAHGDKDFIVYEDERLTFTDVMARVDALGATLVERYGERKGDRVAIGMRNYPEWVVAFAAIVSVGAISVSLNAWWSEDELDYALGDSEPVLLIADRERIERARASCAKRGIRVLAVRADDVTDEGVDHWDDVVQVGAALPQVDIGPDDDATILYTSGTTGFPKGAVSTNRAVVTSIMGFASRAPIEALRTGETAEAANPPSVILVVPLFHVTGSVPVMLGAFIGGAKLTIMYKWDPDRALELIERERVTTFVGVPTQSWDMLQSPRFQEFDTSTLQGIGGGGAPPPPELIRQIDSSFKGGRPAFGYGMTETNALGPGISGDDAIAKPTSAGRPPVTMEVEIRDPSGAPVPVGERGEIWFKALNNIRGYWRKPEETAETIVDGWLRTGDLGRLDEDGFVYVEDRIKDMVLRGGENVYSAEVEAALYEHPAVYEAAVFGLPHERLGEEVAAAVYPRDGVSVTPEELQTHVGKRLAAFKVPSTIVIVSEPLPRNAAGKFLKRQLRESYANA